MISCVVSFLCGICALSLFSRVPSLLYISSFIFIIFIVFLLLRFFPCLSIDHHNKAGSESLDIYNNTGVQSADSHHQIGPKYILFLLFIALIGFLWASLHAEWQLNRVLPKALEKMPITLIGRVVSLPERTRNSNQEETTRFEFDVERTLPEYLWPTPGRVKLRLRHIMNESSNLIVPLNIGDRLKLTVKLKRPHNLANKGGFDKERYFFVNRLSAEGMVIGNSHRISAPLSSPFSYLNVPQKMADSINQYRSKIHTAIFMILNNSPFSGVLAALVVGSRDGITQQQWTVFRESGTAHLMAISGLHVGLVAGWMFAMIRGLYHLLPASCFMIPAQRIAAFCAVLAAFFYAWLAGFSVPTQRAVIMIAVLMLGIACSRKFYVWHSYFVALGLVLLFDPLSTLSPGFWLSFGAVGVLLYGMKGRINTRSLGFWWKWGRAQWVIFLGLIPISLAAFQQISMVAPFANIIAIPWVSLSVVPCVLLGGTLAPFFPKLGEFFLFLAEYFFKLIWPFLERSIHFLLKATWMNAIAGPFELIIAFLGILLLLAPRGFPARKLGIIFLLPLCLKKPSELELNTVCFTLLDVGQGLSAVVETKSHVLLFDTGPGTQNIQKNKTSTAADATTDTALGNAIGTAGNAIGTAFSTAMRTATVVPSDTAVEEGFNAGQNVILPFLTSQGRSKIDTIIISHGDNDHIGGLSSIYRQLPVKLILTSDPEKISEHIRQSRTEKKSSQSSQLSTSLSEPKNIPTKVCVAGQKWSWDGVDFEMLHPHNSTVHESKKRNDLSCVLRIQVGEQSLLLTGDIEARTEQLLLERFSHKLASSILVVPHHGSLTSSSPEFIRAVNPKYALIPVGYKNAYGHPKFEVLDRYRKSGAVLLDSVKDGAISFTLKAGEGVSAPERYRKENNKFWHLIN